MATAPSIPSKYQTLVIDNSENKGFLSKSKRFNYELWAVSYTLSSSGGFKGGRPPPY